MLLASTTHLLVNRFEERAERLEEVFVGETSRIDEDVRHTRDANQPIRCTIAASPCP